MTSRSRVVAGGVVVLALVAGARASGSPLSPVSPEPGLSRLYGSGIAMDSKNNYQVGWTVDQRVSHRFRAHTTSALVAVAFVQRGGPGYSGGDGGPLRISVEMDVGGWPSGTPLAMLDVSPGNPSGHWERTNRLSFSDPAALISGTLYHIVLTNISPTPMKDFISVNEAYQFDAVVPRQPAFSDEVAVLTDRGPGWVVQPNDTPVMDLVYADGQHDGLAYVGVVADHFARISGSELMAGERFAVSGGSRRVSSVSVRVKRFAGSGPLSVSIAEQGGASIATGMVRAAEIPASGLPEIDPADANHFVESSLAGGTWVTVQFDGEVVLAAGRTYDLRLSTDEDTTYVVVPIREQSTVPEPRWGGWAFRDGEAEITRDGHNWTPLYEFGPVDLQFYFT